MNPSIALTGECNKFFQEEVGASAENVRNHVLFAQEAFFFKSFSIISHILDGINDFKPCAEKSKKNPFVDIVSL